MDFEVRSEIYDIILVDIAPKLRRVYGEMITATVYITRAESEKDEEKTVYVQLGIKNMPEDTEDPYKGKPVYFGVGQTSAHVELHLVVQNLPKEGYYKVQAYIYDYDTMDPIEGPGHSNHKFRFSF